MFILNTKTIKDATIQTVQYEPNDNPEHPDHHIVVTFPGGATKGFDTMIQARNAVLNPVIPKEPPAPKAKAKPQTKKKAAIPD